jgi:DNA-directed RNA polymerase subunit K/omega
MNKEIFTKYERARILGARALQISMDAPVLARVESEVLSNLGFDPLKIAQLELDSGVLPISIKRPMPEKKEEKIEKIKVEKVEASDETKQKEEVKEEKSLVDDGGEIMELSNPEDEFDSFGEEGDSDAGGEYE